MYIDLHVVKVKIIMSKAWMWLEIETTFYFYITVVYNSLADHSVTYLCYEYLAFNSLIHNVLL